MAQYALMYYIGPQCPQPSARDQHTTLPDHGHEASACPFITPRLSPAVHSLRLPSQGELTWVAGCIAKRFIRPQTVKFTNPSTNTARCRAKYHTNHDQPGLEVGKISAGVEPCAFPSPAFFATSFSIFPLSSSFPSFAFVSLAPRISPLAPRSS